MKYPIALLFLLLCRLSVAQPIVTFREDFNDNSHKWPQYNSEGTTSKVDGGSYIMNNLSEDNWWYYSIPSSLDPSQDYTIEAEFVLQEGVDNAWFGLVWNLYDSKNYNVFVISNNGQFNFYKDEEGKVKSFSDDQPSSAIAPLGKPNKLEIKKTTHETDFYINGTKVYSIPYVKYFGNEIGFMLGKKQKTICNYIEVRQDHKPEINLPKGLTKGNKLENLGPKINSAESEVNPLISADGRTLYFGRYSKENIGGDPDFEDCWLTELQADGSWGMRRNLGAPINTSGSNMIVALLPDNNTALCMNRYNADGTVAGSGFSTSKRTPTGWSLPTNLNVENFVNNSKYVALSMAPGGDVVIIEMEDDSTYGFDDLYVSFRKDELNWTQPKNLGPVINTPGREFTPFLAADNKTLYFSSDGHPGYGSNDIFVSRRLDDSWTNWSAAENVGPDINSDDWEAYFSVPASGEYAYVVSQKNSLGSADIWRVKLSDAVKPVPVFLVSGRTFNAKTKQPIEAAIKYEVLPEGKDAGSALSAPATGQYSISLSRGKKYGFHAEKEGFFPVSDNLDATVLDKYTEVTKDLYLVPIEVGEVIRINNVFFDFAKYDLRAESYPDLNRLAQFLKANQTVEISLGGHTDNVGGDAANKKLSEDRIQSVRQYLINQGVAESRMTAKGYGKTKPVATNDTEEGRQLNRRVEFTITKK